MSMNLYAETKNGEDVNLWQTPTWVTYMALESWKKNKKGLHKQRHWRDTRKIYLDWVKSHNQGGPFEKKELEELDKMIDEHVRDIMSHKKLRFYVL